MTFGEIIKTAQTVIKVIGVTAIAVAVVNEVTKGE